MRTRTLSLAFRSGKTRWLGVTALVAFVLLLTDVRKAHAVEKTLRHNTACLCRAGEVVDIGELLKFGAVSGGEVSQVTIEYNMLISTLQLDWLYDDEVIGRTVLAQGLRREATFTYGKPLPGKVSLRFRGARGQVHVSSVSAVIETSEDQPLSADWYLAVRESLRNEFRKSYAAYQRKRASAKRESLALEVFQFLEFAEMTHRAIASQTDLSSAFPSAEFRAKKSERRKQAALLEFEHLKQLRIECMAAFARAGFGDVDEPPLSAAEQALLEEIKAFDCAVREERSPLSTRIKLPPHGQRRYLVRTFCIDSGRATPDAGQKFKVVGTAEGLGRRDLSRLLQQAAADPSREKQIQMDIWSDERTEHASRYGTKTGTGQQAGPSQVMTLIAGIESDELRVEASAKSGFTETELSVENRTNRELDMEIGGAILDPVSGDGDDPQREAIAGIDVDLPPLVPIEDYPGIWQKAQLWAELEAAKAVEEYYKDPTDENYDKAQDKLDSWEDAFEGDLEKINELRDAVEAKRQETEVS